MLLNNRRQMPNLQPTVHVHLKRNGSVLVLGSEGAGYQWFPVTLSRLQSTLAGAKDRHGLRDADKVAKRSCFSGAITASK